MFIKRAVTIDVKHAIVSIISKSFSDKLPSSSIMSLNSKLNFIKSANFTKYLLNNAPKIGSWLHYPKDN